MFNKLSNKLSNKLKAIFFKVRSALLVLKDIKMIKFFLFDLNKEFSLYTPFSAGYSWQRSITTLSAINQAFPFLSSLAECINKKVFIEDVDSFAADSVNKKTIDSIKGYFDKYGSDKATNHNYHYLYGTLLKDNDKIKKILEIGIGTKYPDVVSNMSLYGKPGASLRAFRDYCRYADIFGADFDKRILFHEDRIKTFFLNQTDKESFDVLQAKIPDDFDLIIDDGLHSPDANIASLEFGLKKIKVGGWVVIEDISPHALSLWKVVYLLFSSIYEPHIYSSSDRHGNVSNFIFAVKRLK